jgi:hypothetical protein
LIGRGGRYSVDDHHRITTAVIACVEPIRHITRN